MRQSSSSSDIECSNASAVTLSGEAPSHAWISISSLELSHEGHAGVGHAWVVVWEGASRTAPQQVGNPSARPSRLRRGRWPVAKLEQNLGGAFDLLMHRNLFYGCIYDEILTNSIDFVFFGGAFASTTYSVASPLPVAVPARHRDVARDGESTYS